MGSGGGHFEGLNKDRLANRLTEVPPAMLRKADRFLFSGGKVFEPQTTDLRVKGAVGSGSQACFSVSSCVVWVEALNLSECQFPHL